MQSSAVCIIRLSTPLALKHNSQRFFYRCPKGRELRTILRPRFTPKAEHTNPPRQRLKILLERSINAEEITESEPFLEA